MIHAVTHGGPGGATEILVYKASKDGFINLQLGFSAAMMALLPPVPAIVLCQRWFVQGLVDTDK